MAKLVYSILCNDLIVDKETNSTSFIRTVEHAVVSKLPATLPAVYVGTMWELDEEDEKGFSVALQLVPPEGKPETLGMQEVAPHGTVLHKMNFQLPGLNVAQEGRHTLTVAIRKGEEWKAVARLPLYVFLNQGQTATA